MAYPGGILQGRVQLSYKGVMSIKRWKWKSEFEMSMKTLVIYVVNAQQLLSLGLIYFIVISTMLIDSNVMNDQSRTLYKAPRDVFVGWIKCIQHTENKM